jgi:DNA-binding transcriptional MerR regulator
MFRIGDFSRLCRVPVSTLRYYADSGLLEPAQVDRFTGYRYYTLDQFPRLNRILAFKDLGLSLDQIKGLLDEAVTPAEIRGMLRLKRAEIQQHLDAEAARLARVEARLMQIEQEGQMPQQEVVLKTIESQTVIAIREIIAQPGMVGSLIGEVYQAMARHRLIPAGQPIALFHDTEFKPENVDAEVAFPVANPPDILDLGEGRQAARRELPAVDQAACIIHAGDYSGFEATYAALGQWIVNSGYTIAGPSREIYLTPPGENAMTEIQFPVEGVNDHKSEA